MLQPDVRDIIRDTAIADNLTELQKLSKLSRDKQREVAQKIASGKAPNVHSALFKEENAKKVEAAQAEAQTYPAKANIWQCGKYDFFDQFGCYHFDLMITKLPSHPPGDKINQDFVRDMDDTLGLAITRLDMSARAYLFVPPTPRDLKIYLKLVEKSHIELTDILAWSSPRVFRGKVNRHYRDNLQLILYLCGPEAPPLNLKELPTLTKFQQVNEKIDYPFNISSEIPERLIRHSTKPGDVVLDPFPKKGDFLLAAARLGRESFGYSQSKFLVQDAVEKGCILKEVDC